MNHVQWADRGGFLQPVARPGESRAEALGVTRMGGIQVGQGLFTVWVQLRGSSWVEAREGRFRLRSGDWIAFERDSAPQFQADRHGMCLGLALTPAALAQLLRPSDPMLASGSGHAGSVELRTVLRLWRRFATATGPQATAALRPLVLQLAGLQQGLTASLPRCPGRSRGRKQQVFARMQRARLYLEGHRDRVVRIGELAELTSFSTWYFSKTFHQLYGETPQEAAARLRLEHAAELLRETSLMIGEVATSCGFDNPCSFARAFRARYGSSASTYRSAARAQALRMGPVAGGAEARRAA